jgi:hypothetical protein
MCSLVLYDYGCWRCTFAAVILLEALWLLEGYTNGCLCRQSWTAVEATVVFTQQHICLPQTVAAAVAALYLILGITGDHAEQLLQVKIVACKHQLLPLYQQQHPKMCQLVIERIHACAAVADKQSLHSNALPVH